MIRVLKINNKRITLNFNDSKYIKNKEIIELFLKKPDMLSKDKYNIINESFRNGIIQYTKIKFNVTKEFEYTISSSDNTLSFTYYSIIISKDRKIGIIIRLLNF